LNPRARAGSAFIRLLKHPNVRDNSQLQQEELTRLDKLTLKAQEAVQAAQNRAQALAFSPNRTVGMEP